MAIAGFNRETAYVVLSTQGTTSVILGTLLPTLPVLPAAAVAWLLLRSLDMAGEERVRVWRFSGAVYLIGLSLLPWAMALSILIIGVAMFVVLRIARRVRSRSDSGAKDGKAVERERAQFRRIAAWYVVGVTAVTLAFTVFNGSPWLPIERFSGDQDAEGYLLEERTNDLVILQDEPRIVRIIPSEGTDRRFCTNTSALHGGRIATWAAETPPLVAIFTNAGRYDDCEQPS